jgi:hypothetical protein
LAVACPHYFNCKPQVESFIHSNPACQRWTDNDFLPQNSRFMRALNAPVLGSGATALVPTTNIYTLEDEIVLPQVGSRVSESSSLFCSCCFHSSTRLLPPSQPISYLDGASNMALQEVCGPGHVADHL